jgi:hypothetical protein
LSENLRYLVTIDSTSGEALRVEQVGEAGDLTEVDLAGFVRSLGASPGSSGRPQIVINIFAGETPVAVSGITSGATLQAPTPMSHLGFTPAPPPPPTAPPPGKPGKPGKQRNR